MRFASPPRPSKPATQSEAMVRSAAALSLWHLLRSFSWQELRHHPWRNAAVVVAVMLGVALAYAVHVINASALAEFAQALRQTSGQADLELRSSSPSGVSEALYAKLLHHPDVALAAPVLEVATYAQADATSPRIALRVVGVDALKLATLAPQYLPIPFANQSSMAVFAADTVFLNPSAVAALGGNADSVGDHLAGTTLLLQQGFTLHPMHIAGSVQASGNPVAVMDVAAMQQLFDKNGWLSRVDIRLRSGVDKSAWAQAMQQQADWPAAASLREPTAAMEQVDNLSRAYRVNLTVLALVALFTGGFLVFSVLALSVARRAQQFALLGVLGLTGWQRMVLVLLEASLLGLLGSLLGLALGAGLAALALHFIGSDLGGGYFANAAPGLQLHLPSALGFCVLGILAALAGAWWPARLAQQLPLAQTLKGFGVQQSHPARAWQGGLLLGLATLLAFVPPLGDIPLAAYASIALLLLGSILALPWMVGVVLNRVAPYTVQHALPMLAMERARRSRETAAVAVSAIVASLSLSVALTVMVASFRNSVIAWLDVVVPASLYVRSSTNTASNEAIFLDQRFIAAAAQVSGVERLRTQRSLQLALKPELPSLTLLARTLANPSNGGIDLPLKDTPLAVPAGHIGIYVSEAAVDLYGLQLGADFPALGTALTNALSNPLATLQAPSAVMPSTSTTSTSTSPATTAPPPLFVAGIWRDYQRQFGTVAMDSQDFARFSPEQHVTDLALWLAPSANLADVEQALRQQADRAMQTPDGTASRLLVFASTQDIRQTSLKIFDRSFAVTYWLQAVAIGIGLFGVAASFSAQVLVRRKEFGLLAHIGLTRRQILQVVAGEGMAWALLGAGAGTLIGLAIAAVLVYVVNPQSFHWTMQMHIPWTRLALLATAASAAATLTAWASARPAAGRDAVMSVKEDW